MFLYLNKPPAAHLKIACYMEKLAQSPLLNMVILYVPGKGRGLLVKCISADGRKNLSLPGTLPLRADAFELESPVATSHELFLYKELKKTGWQSSIRFKLNCADQSKSIRLLPFHPQRKAEQEGVVYLGLQHASVTFKGALLHFSLCFRGSELQLSVLKHLYISFKTSEEASRKPN